MCQSPGECEHVQLAQTFGQDLQAQLDAEREKTTRQFFRISELQETVKLLAERNALLQCALAAIRVPISEMAAQIICPKNNTFTRILADIDTATDGGR